MVPPSGISSVRARTPVIDSPVGARATVDGVPDVLNFASYNFWALAGRPDIQVRSARLPFLSSTCSKYHSSVQRRSMSQ